MFHPDITDLNPVDIWCHHLREQCGHIMVDMLINLLIHMRCVLHHLIMQVPLRHLLAEFKKCRVPFHRLNLRRQVRISDILISCSDKNTKILLPKALLQGPVMKISDRFLCFLPAAQTAELPAVTG